MRFITVVIASLLTYSAASAQSVEGAWRLTEIEALGGPNPGTMTGTVDGLLVYSGDHFAWSLVIAPDGRMTATDSPSQADLARMTQEFVSSAGTYERDGSTLRYHRIVSLNPAGESAENQPLEREIRQLTSDRLETSFTGAEGATIVLRWSRVD